MANRRDPLLELQPEEEIIFEGPFNRSVSKKLILSNPTHLRVAFKMKTTSPRLFFVRPNIGVLEPKQQVTVEIYVQPMVRQESKLQKRHKFLILAAEATLGADMLNLSDFWRNQKPIDIWETKIKCYLLSDKDERMREAGGGAEHLSSTMSYQGDQFSLSAGASANESMGNLRNQVMALQEERQVLLDKITLYHNDAGAPPFSSDSPKGHQFFKLGALLITIFVAVLAVFAAGKLLL